MREQFLHKDEIAKGNGAKEKIIASIILINNVIYSLCEGIVNIRDINN
ncbi:protein of unknown function [Xenorhabdus doucetiae]|uniref:Uncharacterized protein n=1 Tax=Xenorhabdus doucetiae TaxID=351671 RepID=A0A068QY80_9GAMM|nr:protein of unknown function [Xenorhabdus doucetiae]